MISEKEYDFDIALSTHRKILNCVGIWPINGKNWFADFRWLVTVLIEGSLLNFHFAKIYLHCHGASEVVGSLAPCCAALLGLTRLILARIYRGDLLKILKSIVEDWSTLKEEKNRQIMNKYIEISKRVTTLMIILVSFIAFSFITFAISVTVSKIKKNFINLDLEENSSLIRGDNGTVVRVCVFEKPTFMLVFTILQAVQMTLTCMLTAGSTSFFFGLTMHICGQFDLLAERLDESINRDDRDIVAFVVRRHCHLIKLADYLENSFNLVVLMYLFVTAILLCVEGFLIIYFMKLGKPLEVLHHLFILLMQLLQFSFYAAAGEYLETRSVSLSNAIYNYDWYERPVNVMKDLTMIIMRAHIPHRLTAGKFVSLNMITFKDILKSTASYLSVLRVMMDV